MEESTKPTHYPLLIQSDKFNKLLAVQSYPERKFFFQDKEVSEYELIRILDNIKTELDTIEES